MWKQLGEMLNGFRLPEVCPLASVRALVGFVSLQYV